VGAAFPLESEEGARDSRLTAFLGVPFLGVPFVCVALVVGRGFGLAGSGVGGAVSLFTRDDFLTPFSNTVVGPSATKAFQGGDTARDAERRGVVSSSFRRFAGRSMTPPPRPFTDAWWSSSLITGVLSAWTASPFRAASDALGAVAESCGGMESMSRSAGVISIQEGRGMRPGEPGDHPAHCQIDIYRLKRGVAR
jgi:hypothetical protein